MAQTRALMTYDQWKQVGYQVKRGSKACARDSHNQALFSRDQVMAVLENPGEQCLVCGSWGHFCKCTSATLQSSNSTEPGSPGQTSWQQPALFEEEP